MPHWIRFSEHSKALPFPAALNIIVDQGQRDEWLKSSEGCFNVVGWWPAEGLAALLWMNGFNGAVGEMKCNGALGGGGGGVPLLFWSNMD